MTKISAYLKFDGNCRDAMTFYKEALGGELFIQSVGESPVASSLPPEIQNNIMHASLTNAGINILASDMLDSGERVKGNFIALTLNCSSEEEINRYFKALSAGGKITQPLKLEFWGAIFGMLIDKYGYEWMLNFDKSPKP